MNAASLLNNFGHLANAPGGIDQIRQLVMAFGLMGRLTLPNEQLQTDLDLALKKGRLIYLKSNGKKDKPLLFGDPLISEFDIPSGWSWRRVGELCDLQTGATPSRRRPEYFGGDIRWLVSGDINLREIFECDGRITQEGLDNSNCKIIPPDSVLIALNGQGKTRATVALLRVPAACNQSLVAMIPFDRGFLLPDYLYLALRYRYFEIRDITGQNQRRGLNMGLVAELSVPLAPIEEQKRIVAKVDELMALCDKLEEQQQEKERRFPVLSRAFHARFVESPKMSSLKAIFDEAGTVSLEDFRMSVLDLAVQGRLVKQRTEEGLASDQIIVRKNRRLPPILDDELSFAIPESWVWRRLGQVADTINGDRGKNYPNKREYVAKGIPFINTGHIEPDGSLSSQSMHYITREKFDSLRSGKIKKGDLVYCLRGATLGKTAFVEPYMEGAIASSLVIIRLDENINRRYAFYFLRSPFGRRLIRRFDNGSAQPNLAAGSVRKYVFPLPPPAEQRRIVTKVDQLMALIDKLEEQQRMKAEVANAFVQAAVTAITGAKVKEPETMKTPKTELVSRIQASGKPKATDLAPLAVLLAKHKGELPAKTLWQQSGMEINAFYQQLRTEMANGWIVEPEKAVVREVDTH